MQISDVNTTDNQARNREYVRRSQIRMLKGFPEYSSVRFSFGISLAIFFVIFFNSFDFAGKAFSYSIAGLSILYLLQCLVIFAISKKMRSEIVREKEIKISTRRLGILLLMFTAAGNIFAAMAGFMLIKKDKGIEYILSIYMILVSICIMLISSLNLFKDYVADTFLPGMGLLGVITVFYILVIFMIAKHIKGKAVAKRMLPVGVLLIITAFTGNVFAAIIAVIIFSKYKNRDKDSSIEWIDIITRLFRNNMAIIGMFVVVLLLSLSICSYMTFDYSIAIDNDYSSLLLKPSIEYPFGTDNYGRCAFTRIVFGARISLVIGIIATVLPMVVGGMLGAVAGYYGGKIDNALMRCLDILYAVPDILLAIAIIAAFGTSTVNLVLAISVSSIAIYARTVRATVMSISSSEFVEAARACGARDFTIIVKHIIPNSLAPIIVRATMGIGAAVLSTSSLSYLGLGVEPHIPEWGNILKMGSKYLETDPHLAIFPGLAIILIVLAFNFFGDGLRDALDPKLK